MLPHLCSAPQSSTCRSCILLDEMGIIQKLWLRMGCNKASELFIYVSLLASSFKKRKLFIVLTSAISAHHLLVALPAFSWLLLSVQSLLRKLGCTQPLFNIPVLNKARNFSISWLNKWRLRLASWFSASKCGLMDDGDWMFIVVILESSEPCYLGWYSLLVDSLFRFLPLHYIPFLFLFLLFCFLFVCLLFVFSLLLRLGN